MTLQLLRPQWFDHTKYRHTASLFKKDLPFLYRHLEALGVPCRPVRVDQYRTQDATLPKGSPITVGNTRLWQKYAELFDQQLSEEDKMGYELTLSQEIIDKYLKPQEGRLDSNLMLHIYSALRWVPLVNIDLYPNGQFHFQQAPQIEPGVILDLPPLLFLSLHILLGGKTAMPWEIIDAEIPLAKVPGAPGKAGRDGIREWVAQDKWPLLRLKGSGPDDQEPPEGTSFHYLTGIHRVGSISHDLTHVAGLSLREQRYRKQLPAFHDSVWRVGRTRLDKAQLLWMRDIVFTGTLLKQMGERKNGNTIPNSDNPFEATYGEVDMLIEKYFVNQSEAAGNFRAALHQDIETNLSDPWGKQGYLQAMNTKMTC